MNLVIDIGNTAVKVYLFKNNEIIKREVLSENALIHYLKLIAIDDIRNIICSSVTKSYKDQYLTFLKIQIIMTFQITISKSHLQIIMKQKNLWVRIELV